MHIKQDLICQHDPANLNFWRAPKACQMQIYGMLRSPIQDLETINVCKLFQALFNTQNIESMITVPEYYR